MFEPKKTIIQDVKPPGKQVLVLTTTDDFVECGKVSKLLKSNPKASNTEIVIGLKIPVARVAGLRTHIENELLSAKSAQKDIPQTLTVQQLSQHKTVERNKNAESIESRFYKDKVYKSVTDNLIENHHKIGFNKSTHYSLNSNPVENEQKTELNKSCKNCTIPISIETFETFDELCTECYYRKLSGHFKRIERHAGVLGKDRTY